MRYAMNRRDYELLMVQDEGEKYIDELGEKAAAEMRAKFLADEYPKSTAAVVEELRTRGLDVREPVVEYLLRKGEIPAPSGGDGRNRKWTPADIDCLAEYLEAREMWVPGTVARMFYNIDPGQDIRALRQAFRENPDVVPDPDYFVMEIVPGAAGAGVYATVRYRRMTKAEEAEWKRKIIVARNAEKRGKKHD